MEPPEYWANAPHSKQWEDVNEGGLLLPLEFPVTTKVLIAAAIGTHDFIQYHHDREYNLKYTAARDMFLNTFWQQAFMGRLCTDWAGAESDIRGMTLRMLGQICPGDVVTGQGTVQRKYVDGEDHCVDIDIEQWNQLGPTARSMVTLAMPSREAGPVKPRLHLEKPKIEPNPDMPDFARAWLGTVGQPVWGGYPVSYPQIMYWCDMTEDGNPLYVDGEYARKGRYGGVIAPWHSLYIWGMGRAGHTGINLPDTWAPQRKPWPPREKEESMITFNPPGVTETLAVGVQQEYGPPFRPGDHACAITELATCTPLKDTRFGKGYFVTTLTSFYNQRDVLVGTHLFTLLRYGIKE